ncbi:MAG: MFS transporter [Dehalococcoidia bacterium]|nr:MFS transporter [Dehalococcoidia bacterium]
MKRLFRPVPTMSERDASSGLRWLLREGMASLGLGSITTSGFMAAFALILGANNLQIGILAAIPFLTQPLQMAAIPLVERVRKRKLIAVAAWLPAQLLWVPIALIPVFLDVPGAAAISVLLILMAARGILTAVCNCAWNSWTKDLVPQSVLGRVFAKRQTLAAIAAMVFGLSAAFFIDYWRHSHVTSQSEAMGYMYPLLIGALTLGLASPLFMSFMPEPLMQPLAGPQPSLTSKIASPFRDANYRRLIRFLFFWGIAINLATPFFAVYMLQRLGLPVSLVIGFSVISQAVNIVFFGFWGRLADKFSNKTVLSLSVSLYLLVILGWVFTTMPERYFFTIPLLVILHILAGIAASGVGLTTGTIGLKLAPQGQATSYLAASALAWNLGAGLGPLLGGYFADYFSVRELGVNLTWMDPTRSFDFAALHLTGFDFLFGIAFILGLMTLAFLSSLREEGEVGREVVLESLFAPMRSLSRPMSSVPVLHSLGQFPYGHLIRSRVPGLDVAMGVTVYEIAGMAKAAAASVAEGKKAFERLAKPLEEALSSLWESLESAAHHGGELAHHTARGAMHAADTMPHSTDAAYDIMLAVTGSMVQANVDPRESIRGTASGIVRGAGEAGLDVGRAAQCAVLAATEASRQTGISSEVAVTEAVTGILEAAEGLGPEAVSKVKEALGEQPDQSCVGEST